MGVAAVRTSAAACLTAAVAVRASTSEGTSHLLARITSDPGRWLTDAATGWTVAGTLGDATAEGIRSLPLAALAWLGETVGAPAAAVQTVWYLLVLLLALLGALRLADAASARRSTDPEGGIGGSWSVHVAAVLYACGPVLLATLSGSPADSLVAAALPWIAAPLVSGATGWRPAATSAAWLGVAGVGSAHWAVAAALVGMVAAAPLVRTHAAQLGRWLLLAVLASAWWVAMLVWERSHATDVTGLLTDTDTRDLVSEALGAAGWSLGWLLVAAAAPLVIATAALALRAGGRGRPLTIGLLGLSALAIAAHLGLELPVIAADVSDGAPNPLSPVLAWLALAALVSWAPLVEQLHSRLPERVEVPGSVRQLLPVLVAAAVVVTTVAGFALAVRERPAAAAATSAGLWDRVAQWSDDAPDGRVLVLPAVDSRLEPQVADALEGRPWVARDPLPRSSAAGTAALDHVVWRLSRGLGGPGTRAALDGLGIAYVIVRNDLPTSDDRVRPSALVRQALVSQGAIRMAVFPANDERTGEATEVTDFGVRTEEDSVEVWSTGRAPGLLLYDESTIVAAGDAGTAADLADAGLAGSTALTLSSPDDSVVELLSDSARRQDVDQREALDPFGPYLMADADPEVVPSGAARPPTASRRLTGVRSISASSSAADLGAVPRRPEADPVAALDGNVFTAWQPADGAGVGQWWEVVFSEPTDLSEATAQLVQNVFVGGIVTRVRLEYDGASTEVDVPPGGLVSLAPAGVVNRLRIVATDFEADAAGRTSFGISELTVPGIAVRDELVVSGPATQTWLLASRPSSHVRCAPAAPGAGSAESGADLDPGDIATACDPGLSVGGPDNGPIDRVLDVDESVEVTGRVWMRAADSDIAAKMVDLIAEPSVVVTGSSVAAPDLSTRPQAAADDDDTTAWRPSPEDEQPTLTLTWDSPRRVNGLRILVPPDGPASTPTRVQVQAAAAGSSPAPPPAEADVTTDGTVRTDPVRTTQLTVTFLADDGLTSVDTLTVGRRQVPIAVAEVEVLGGPEVVYDDERVRTLPCGSGPSVTLAGDRVATSATASADDLVRASMVRARLCDRPTLPAGQVPLKVQASNRWVPLGIVLSGPDGPFGEVDRDSSLPPGEAGPQVLAALPSGAARGNDAVLDVQGDGSGTLTLAVPAGKGWSARVGDQTLDSVTVDGWSQGWVVPAGTEQVVIDYSAARSLRWAVGSGLVGWAAVLALAVLGSVFSRSRGWKKPRDQAIVGRSTQA